MKKVFWTVAALVLCACLVLSVAAVGSEFVPSITYKGGPEVLDADLGQREELEDVHDCLVVTTIEQAKEKTTDITQEERDELLRVYKELSDGTMELPLEGDYVIRELLDVSFEYQDCRQIADHGQKDEVLAEEDVVVVVDFDLGIGADVEIVVLYYFEGEWHEAEKVVNNGDGTVTVEFEDLCPVAFCVV